MNIHKNASMTLKGRAHFLVHQIDRIDLKPAAAAGGLSTRTAHKWQRRFVQEGRSGLSDRSSRLLGCPQRSRASKIEQGRSVAQDSASDLWMRQGVQGWLCL